MVNDVDDYSKSRIWNGSDSYNKISVHKASDFPFVFVICCWCSWITMQYLQNLVIGYLPGFVGWWNWDRGMGRVPIVVGCDVVKVPLSLLQLETNILERQHLLLERYIPIFTCHVLGTIGQSTTYFFFLPHILRLMSSLQNPKLILHVIGGAELLCMLEIDCNVFRFRLWHCIKNLY